MKFLKSHRLSARGVSSRTSGINYDARGLTNIESTNALVMPSGTTAQRPDTAVAGMMRYNTSESDFEVYQGGEWKPVRYREPITITNQNLGNGDGSEKVFGPLDSGDAFYPVPIAEANVLVFVDSVIQLPVTNYSLVQNPDSSHGPNDPYAAGWYIVFGTAVPSGKPVNVIHNLDK